MSSPSQKKYDTKSRRKSKKKSKVQEASSIQCCVFGAPRPTYSRFEDRIRENNLEDLQDDEETSTVTFSNQESI